MAKIEAGLDMVNMDAELETLQKIFTLIAKHGPESQRTILAVCAEKHRELAGIDDFYP